MVGLVVLTMLTVLAISTITMTSLELRVAGNMQNRNKAFQSANSMLDLVFYATGSDPNRINFNDDAPQSFGPVSGDGVSSTASSAFTASGTGILCPGNSLRSTCNFYRVTAKSTHSASSASSTQVLGLYKTGIVSDD